tara:strand:- start:2040 stop:2273 length:234 start_codon:yes stop_codon:yes gene_type:complete
MAKVITQSSINMPRLMEAGEYRKLRYAGREPSLQKLKKWIDEGVVVGEIKGGVYFVDLQAELLGSDDELLAKMVQVA